MKPRAAAALLATFLAANAMGEQSKNAIVIDAKDSATPASAAVSLGKYLNGYHSSIDGQTIEYRSSDPDADSALLVRGQRVAHKVSWQTDPLPESSGDSYQLIWLAGIECAGFSAEKESHPFNLLIDGQLWFTFKNAKDATAKAWHVAGRDGAELSFIAHNYRPRRRSVRLHDTKTPRKRFPVRQTAYARSARRQLRQC